MTTTDPSVSARTKTTGSRPWARLVALVVLFLLVDLLAAGALAPLAATTNPFRAVLTLVLGVVAAAVALRLYRVVVSRLEHRDPQEIATVGAWAGVMRGFSIGTALFTGVIVLLAVFGGYRISGWNSLWAALATLGLMIAVAVMEELLFRAVLYRVVEEIAGPRTALIVSAVIFGGLHLLNEKATIWGAAAIAVEGGLMMAAMYATTRSIWLPVGVHLAWNFAEAGLFGVTVSGSDSSGGLVHGVLSGPALFTGGDFGPEAGLPAILVCLVPTVIHLRRLRASR